MMKLDPFYTLWILMILLLILYITLLARVAKAEPDIYLLRDVICAYETRGEPNRNTAVSYANAVGRCQILPIRAEEIGCMWWRLNITWYSQLCALLILEDCQLRFGSRLWNIARCYNPSRSYIKTIAVKYAQARMLIAWRGR